MVIVLKNKKGEDKFFKINKKLVNEQNTIVLTTKEFLLLEKLYYNKNRVLEFKEFMEQIWEKDNNKNRRSMQVYCCRLRKKLKDFPIEIITFYTKGLLFKINN